MRYAGRGYQKREECYDSVIGVHKLLISRLEIVAYYFSNGSRVLFNAFCKSIKFIDRHFALPNCSESAFSYMRKVHCRGDYQTAIRPKVLVTTSPPAPFITTTSSTDMSPGPIPLASENFNS